MKLAKNLIISLVVGIIGFVIVDYVNNGTISIPANSDAISTLIVIIVAVYIGAVLASAGSAGSADALFEEDDDREQGTVKWFNVKKGYGFITRDEGDDVFVHYRNIKGQGRRAISEGQRVEFSVVKSEKGLQAEEVEPL